MAKKIDIEKAKKLLDSVTTINAFTAANKKRIANGLGQKNEQKLVPALPDRIISDAPGKMDIVNNRVLDIGGIINKPKLHDFSSESLGDAPPSMELPDTGKHKTFKAAPINLETPSLDGLNELFSKKTNRPLKETLSPDTLANLDVQRADLSNAEAELGALSDFLLSDKLTNDQLRAAGKAIPGRLSPTVKGEDDNSKAVKLLVGSDLAQQGENRKGAESASIIDNLLKANELRSNEFDLKKTLGLSKDFRENRDSSARAKRLLSLIRQADRGLNIKAEDSKTNAIASAFRNTVSVINAKANSRNLDERTIAREMQRQVVILKEKLKNKQITNEEFFAAFDRVTRGQ